nr:hypothetical protein [Acidaminococcus hominis]
MKDKQKQQIIALRREGGGVWQHSLPIGPFHQHREIVLPAAQSG